MLAKPWEKEVFMIRSLNLENEGRESVDCFSVGKTEILEKGWFGNYFRGVVNIIAKHGLAHRLRGMWIVVKSQIPIGSGLSSSAALEVAFMKLLNHVCDLGYGDKDLAELAYLAETKEVGVPCGRLDQYGAVFGGVIKLECRAPFNVEPLPFKDLTFTILDSGVRHATADIHPVRQSEINSGLKLLMESVCIPEKIKLRLGYRYDEPMWDEVSEQEIQPYLPSMDENVANRLLYTLRAHESTEFALKVLRREHISDKELVENLGKKTAETIKGRPLKERAYWILGEVMNYQHTLLRDLYDVSLPQLERIRDAALEAGAYGVKISGAGMGGSLIALVKDAYVGQRVLSAGLNAGAKQGWVSKVGNGARIEKTGNLEAL
jgi:galactokinase